MLKQLLGRVSGESERANEQARQLIAAGNLIEDAGRLQEACVLYRQAMQLAPKLAATHLNLGIALAAAGDLEGAAHAYESVLAIDPEHAFGNYNFANLAYSQGDLSKAEALVLRALRAKPDLVDGHVLLSNVLDEAGESAAAIAALQEAIRLKPDYAGAHFNCALLLRKVARFDEARAAANRANELDPRNPETLSLLASILKDQGFMMESMELTRRAVGLAPQRFDLRSLELFSMNFDERADPEELYQGHAAFGALLENTIPARFAGRHLGGKEGQRRLRIGYVSGDLRVHPVALFLIPVLERRNREAWEVFCYSCDKFADQITERIQQLADHWVDASTLADAQLAQRIHADAIDILVDLSGHTGASRLAAFAEKPAPVQVTWLGYLNTTGLTRIDFRLCDARTDPAQSSRYHSESLLALPGSQWCYRPFLHIECAPAAPFEQNGYVTFGSFNQAAKISSAMCMRWAQILEQLPGSCLLIADVRSEAKKASIRAAMEQAGIAADRLHFEPRADLASYYALYNRVDIALDTYPYGGGTTTFDSIWMGVPVVTATGALPASRSAGSILAVLGLSEWSARAVDEYVGIAVHHARDTDNLARLRRSLRTRLATSELMDEQRFVRNFETALRNIWVDHCATSQISGGE